MQQLAGMVQHVAILVYTVSKTQRSTARYAIWLLFSIYTNRNAVCVVQFSWVFRLLHVGTISTLLVQCSALTALA
jgi:hypothetical protein